jgi:hypothetical protein
MDLLDRYLQAVEEYLPTKGRADVLAELRANLLDQMDEREETLGRPLTQDEVAEILRSHGHPSIVAARYQPRRSLIGPEIFPYYWFTLRKTFPLVIGVFILSRAVQLIYGSSHPENIVGATLVSLFTVLFYFAGWMTLAFAAIGFICEHYPQKVDFYANWDPRKLSRLSPEQERQGVPKYPRVDLFFHVLGLLWLLSIPRHPGMLFFAIGPTPWVLTGANMGFAPVWHAFYWAVVALNVLQLIFKLILLNRSAQPWRIPMKLVERVLGFTLLVFLVQVKEYLVFRQPVTDPIRLMHIASINQNIHQGLLVVVVIVGLKLLWDGGQMVMRSRQPGTVAHIMA